MDFRIYVADYLNREIEVLRALDIEAINTAISAIIKAWEEEATIYTLGNGGSAATASHMVCDFNKGVSEKVGKRKFHFTCLSDNMALNMAIANDISYEDVFRFQLEGNVKAGDLLIAISGSGNSLNAVKAVEFAKDKGAKIIAMTGYDGGRLKQLADYPLHVSIDDMQIAEDVHMVFNHMMMQILCAKL